MRAALTILLFAALTACDPGKTRPTDAGGPGPRPPVNDSDADLFIQPGAGADDQDALPDPTQPAMGAGPGGGPGGGSQPGESVPEPGTLLLVGSGLAGIAFSLRRRPARRLEGAVSPGTSTA